MPCLRSRQLLPAPKCGETGVPRSRLKAAKPLLDPGVRSETAKRDSPQPPRYLKMLNAADLGPSIVRIRKRDDFQVWLPAWKLLLSRHGTARATLDDNPTLAAFFTVTTSHVCPLSPRRSSERDTAAFHVVLLTPVFLLSHELN
jgi:hypothetical protein